MKIVPAPVEQYVSRVDPRYRTWVGIGWALLAASSAIRVLWLIFAAFLFAEYGFSPVSLIFGVVMWSVIGVVGVIGAVAFLTHNDRIPRSEQYDERSQR